MWQYDSRDVAWPRWKRGAQWTWRYKWRLLTGFLILTVVWNITWAIVAGQWMDRLEHLPYLPVHEAAKNGDVRALRRWLDSDPQLVHTYGCDRDATNIWELGTPLDYALHS